VNAHFEKSCLARTLAACPGRLDGAEFKRMVGLGMAPGDANQSATSPSGEMLDMKGGSAWSLRELCGIVAVSGDPLEGCWRARAHALLMKDGAVSKTSSK